MTKPAAHFPVRHAPPGMAWPTAATLAVLLLSGSAAGAHTLKVRDVCADHLDILGGTGQGDLPSNLVLTTAPDGDQTLTSPPERCSAAKTSAMLKVPQGTAIIVENQVYDTSINIGGVEGAVTATTNSGTIAVDSATNLDISLIGSGDATIGHVSGTLMAQTLGTGDLTISSADLARANLVSVQTGDILIRGGMIGTLAAETHETGDITVRAPVENATLTLLGNGDITLASVSGKLVRLVTGNGDLSIGNRPNPPLQTPAPPLPASPPTQHHTHRDGHGWITLIVICVVVTSIFRRRARRRQDRAESRPMTETMKSVWDDAANGYGAFVHNWEQRMAEQRARTTSGPTPSARAGALWDGLTDTARQERARRHDRAAHTAGTPHPLDAHHPLALLQDRMRRLEPRLARMEHFVTSSDFALERQFRDLERS